MAKTGDDDGEEPSPILLVDNMGAPDVFADFIAGAFLTNGNVHMTFAARRCDYTKKPNVFNDVVIGRLVMPLPALEGMTKFLTDYVEKLKTGADMSPATPKRVLQ